MIYVVKSLFNSDITDGLYNGFIKSFEGTKIKENLKLIDVPGAYDRSGTDMSSNKGYEVGLMARNILSEEKNENFSNH